MAITDQTYEDISSIIERGDNDGLVELLKEREVKADTYYQYYRSTVSRGFYGGVGPVGRAARDGHMDVMKTLISEGFLQYEDGHRAYLYMFVSPLQLACVHGRASIVKSLVEDYDVQIVQKDNCYRRPLLLSAVAAGSMDVLTYLMEERGVDVNSTCSGTGTCALIEAAEMNQNQVCEYLLSHGAEVDIRDKHRATSLMVAARCGNDVIVRVLLAAGADIKAVDDAGRTALLNAIELDRLGVVKILISAGSDPNVVNDQGSSPLLKAVIHERHDIAKYLIIGMNVDMNPISMERSPLAVVLCKGNFKMADLFINVGYNPGRELKIYRQYESHWQAGTELSGRLVTPGKKRRINRTFSGMDSELHRKVRELKYIARNARPLLQLCCFRIRHLMNRRIPTKVDCLPLPERLKDFIKLRHVQ